MSKRCINQTVGFLLVGLLLTGCGDRNSRESETQPPLISLNLPHRQWWGSRDLKTRQMLRNKPDLLKKWTRDQQVKKNLEIRASSGV